MDIIILTLGILFILILVILFNNKSSFGTGYSSNESPYILPKVYENLITPEEGNYILNYGSYSESVTIGGINSDIRKSETKWIPNNDSVYNGILDRLSIQFNFNKVNCEQLQVVKYQPDGYYKEHHDSCCDESELCEKFSSSRGQRILTILVYLSDDFEGGATKFPNLNLELKAPKYGGIVFYPMAEDENKCHPNALHAGMPVTSGVKYICNIWVREK